MKKFFTLIAFASLLFFSSCEGSDTYQGKWKAMDQNGAKSEITFSPKSFSIKDSTGKSKAYEYTQNSVSSKNSVETYGIHLSDGRGYQIYFPLKDESIGMILDENGKQMYTISRKNYIAYEDIYKLN